MMAQTEILTQLVVAVPAAVAVVVTVIVFLKHIRKESQSRDDSQKAFLHATERERTSRDNERQMFADTISTLSVPITELTTEVKLLRRDHEHKS